MLQDISFSLSKGCVAALVGPNGSGKTTLVRLMLGFLEPTEGQVHLFGGPPKQGYGRVGYVPQRLVPDASAPLLASEWLALMMKQPSSTKLSALTDAVEFPESSLSTPISQLSGGQWQRLLIAQALAENPELLILDEPSSFLDRGGEASLYALLSRLNQEKGLTILLVSHDLHLVASFVDQVFCVNHRLLCSGSPREVFTQEKLSEVFGTSAALFAHDHHTH